MPAHRKSAKADVPQRNILLLENMMRSPQRSNIVGDLIQAERFECFIDMLEVNVEGTKPIDLAP